MVCAVGADGDLGIDVEKLSTAQRSMDVAKRFFAPAEIAYLQQVDAEHRAETFLRIWTLKEAYVKARGLGLNVPLQSFGFRLNPPSLNLYYDDLHDDDADEASHWHFAQWAPTQDYIIALAHKLGRTTRMTVVQRAVSMAEL
ncbi:MAG TPA: 4'-phosphopantetheinyl transferase superfamily protein [Xanthobacteraceae bacterium]|nr:4'-phosphopantetheinyl transferase superfamily protein [Xanthobacteraceae bacterium]